MRDESLLRFLYSIPNNSFQNYVCLEGLHYFFGCLFSDGSGVHFLTQNSLNVILRIKVFPNSSTLHIAWILTHLRRQQIRVDISEIHLRENQIVLKAIQPILWDKGFLGPLGTGREFANLRHTGARSSRRSKCLWVLTDPLWPNDVWIYLESCFLHFIYKSIE